MTFQDFLHPLLAVYDSGEARAVARLVMESRYGLSLTDIACGEVERCDERDLESVLARLLQSEPVQYVLGEAAFCGRKFRVGPGVLIPRPETEWLCRKAVELMSGRQGVSVLDVGTGSGCIACTIALDLAPSNIKEVVAWDISDRAIALARENASALGACVTVEKADALRPPACSCRRWDVIVSNPPYICQCEREAMHDNVLRYEPASALFVPDADPLLFYRAIARYALYALKSSGVLLFEVNPTYADGILAMAVAMGFSSVTLADDYFGKRRYAVITA